MCSIAEEDTTFCVQTLLVKVVEFFEEAGNVYYAAAADEVQAIRIHEARGKNVEVVCLAIGNYRTANR